jgi:hypothetical protein
MRTAANEHERAQQLVRDIAGLTMPTFLDQPLESPTTPNENNMIEGINLVTDPCAQGPRTIWTAFNGASAPVLVKDDLPPRLTGAAQVKAAAGATALKVICAFTTEEAGVYWYYAMVRTDSDGVGASDMNCRLEASGGVPIGTDNFMQPASARGWVLGRGSATLAAATTYYVVGVLSANAVQVGQMIRMTAATVCQDTDPGEPFWGDLALTENYAYAWQGAGNASRSIRYGKKVDMLALLEREAELGEVPVGMTDEQRQAYLLSRYKARNKSSGQSFQEGIVDLIKIHDPSFNTAQVRVRPNVPARTLRVEIAYSPTAVMADRVKRLIVATKPAGLKLDPDTDIVWGGFQAGVNAAGDPV